MSYQDESLPTVTGELRRLLDVPVSLDGLANLLNGIRLLVECGDREGTVIALGYAHRLTKVLGGERA